MQINMKKGKLVPVSWMQPHPGGSSLMCSKCQCPDYKVFSFVGQLRCSCGSHKFAVHVDKLRDDTVAVHETICTGCRAQTKLSLDGTIDGRLINGLECAKCKTRTVLEANAVIDRRGGFLKKQSKRRIYDGDERTRRGDA